MKTAFTLAACLVACLFFLETHGQPRRPPGGPPRPPPVNETEDFSGPPRGGRPPGPPRGRPYPPVNGTDANGSSRPGKHPGGPRRPPFALGNETDYFNETARSGKRFPGRHEFNKTKEFDGVSYDWFRQVDEKTTVKEGARIKNGSDTIFVRSNVEGNGYSRALIVYDYTNNTAIVIISIRIRFAPCFIENTTKTFEEVSNDVASKNDTTVESTSNVSKTAVPLSKEEEAAYRESNRILDFICRNRPIYRLVLASADDQPSDKNNAKAVFNNLDIENTVTYPKPTGYPAGGKPRKGGRGSKGGERGRDGKEGEGGRGGRGGQGPYRGYD